MTKLLILNGKSYKAAPFDVNLVCDFEESGISLEDIENKMFSVLRAYVAASVGCDIRTAGRIMSEHVNNGGALEDIAEVMTVAMNESGFFRDQQTSEETPTPARTRKKKAENEEVISTP